MYLEPSVKKFKKSVSQRRVVQKGLKNPQKNVLSPIDGHNFLKQFEVGHVES